MVEIGTTLQDARTRKGLALPDAAEATRIRVKFLAALEAERFGELPADVYARGFLRTYGEYLGLDGDLLVSELTTRIEASRPPPPPPPEPRVALPAVEGRVWALLGVSTLLVLAGVLGLQNGSRPAQHASRAVKPPVAALASATADRPSAARRPERAATAIEHLTLVAARGDCWLSVHVSSRNGRVAYQGLLRMGESVPLVGKRFWIRIGAPWNLDAKLNGRLLTGLPQITANVLVTTAGMRPA